MLTPDQRDDVQALVFTGHPKLSHAVALRLRLHDAAPARAGLQRLVVTRVNFGLVASSTAPATQLLLSAEGIAALGITGPTAAWDQVDRPFRQGMATPQRSRALGDLGPADPQHWHWRDQDFHALVLLYATTPAALATETDVTLATLGPAWSVAGTLPLRLTPDGREPFGFKDGVSGTHVDRLTGSTPKGSSDELPPGEIIPGQRDAAGLRVAAAPWEEGGSYLAVRQLAQDVSTFWSFWRTQAGGEDATAVWLAAKALGRWPNGLPVSGSEPHAPPPLPPPDAPEMPLSFAADPHGDRCPFGAHIRRANPRDGLLADPAASRAVVARRRLLRRGRVYGPPADAAWYPEAARPAEALPGADPSAERGLLFLALCADLVRQFEFVQQTWLNNPKFAGAEDEVDPIAAPGGLPGDSQRFSIPRDPVRLRICGIQPWVTVRAGGYFLLPGRRALLSHLTAAS